MLKQEKINIFISYRNYTHYIKLGYNAILNQSLEINTKHLPTSSHVRVDAICEICGMETNLQYHKYLVNKNRHGFYGCKPCSRQKASLTCLDKYGVDNYSKTKEYKERTEATNLEKFGYKTNLLCPVYKEKIKEILIEKYGTEKHWEIRKKKNKFIFNDLVLEIKDQKIDYSEDFYEDKYIEESYYRYRGECRRLTKKNTKRLYDSWDGTDFYDGEFILDNFNMDSNDPSYPTIDHKKSIYWGFKNSIPVEEIAKIENLCMTKRSINSKKRESNYLG